MQDLNLTKLEMHIIAMCYNLYVEENPDNDQRSQKRREEIGLKLAQFSKQFYNTDYSITLSAMENKPVDLSSQRTKRAMHDLATSSDVLTGDLSNGLEPLTESEDN